MKALITHNLVFLPITASNTFANHEPLYVAADRSGTVLINEIYTLAAIKVAHPELKELAFIG